MPMKFDDRGRETNTAPGTGNFPAGTAVQGGISLATFLTTTGHYTTYEADNGTAWETGILTRQSDGSYARTVKRSTNGNAAVNFSTGVVSVSCDAPAWMFDHLNMIEETVTSAATFDVGAAQTLRIAASGTTGPVTSLGTSPNKLRTVRWAGATVTHHATSLILIGGVNWPTAANDVSWFASDASGNWRELLRQYAGGLPTASYAADSVTYAKIQNVSATDKLLGRSTAGAGDVEEIACTAAGRALIDDADAAAQRTTLALGNVDNTSDANKPVSSAAQTALNLKANIASPTFTGTLKSPLTQFADAASNSVGGSPCKAALAFDAGTSVGFGLKETAGTDSGRFFTFVNSSDAQMGSIARTNSTTTAFTTTSDKNLKHDEHPVSRSGEIIDQTQVWDYAWRSGEGRGIGVFAQDAYKVFPDAITPPQNKNGLWQADYSKYVPVLLAEVQSLRRRIAVLEAPKK